MSRPSVADLLRAELAAQNKTGIPPAPTDDADPLTAAIQRRYADSDERRARLLGVKDPQTPPDDFGDRLTEYGRVHEARTSAQSKPMPLNGHRVTDAVASALRGPGTTVTVPGQ